MSNPEHQTIADQFISFNLPEGVVSFRLALDRALGDTLFVPALTEPPSAIGPPAERPAGLLPGRYRVEFYNQDGQVLDAAEPAFITFGTVPPPAVSTPKAEEQHFNSEQFLKGRQLAHQVEFKEEGLLSYKVYHEFFREMMTALRDLRALMMEMAKDDWNGRAERNRSQLEFEGQTLDILKKRLEELGEGKAAYTEIATSLIGAIQTIWVASVRRPRRKKTTTHPAGSSSPAQDVHEAEFRESDEAAQHLLEELVNLGNPARFQSVMKDPAERDRFVKRLDGIRKGHALLAPTKESP